MMLFLSMANIGAVVVTMLLPFFKKVRLVPQLVLYFALPVAILNLVFFKWNIIGMTDGFSALSKFDLKVLFYFFEQGLLWALIMITILKYRPFKMDVRTGIDFVLAIIGLFIISMPVYFAPALFGTGPQGRLENFSQEHRIALYLAFILPMVVWFMFKRKDYETKRFACLVISLCAMYAFAYRGAFKNLITPGGAPLQLCNTAMYLLPLCFAFKMKRLFYFSLFINVLGAFLALIVPDQVSNHIFNEIGFWQNHIIAFGMPLVAIGLGLFERPKLRQYIYSTVAFTVYFVFIALLNAFLTKYNPDVNYFFLNGDTITSKLGKWAERIRLKNVITFTIGGFKYRIFWLYVLIFYFVYIAAGLLIWFIYEGGYAVADNWHILFERNYEERQKKKQYKYLKKETLNEKKENEKMLKIINFSKRYGSSANFAVEDASLEIKAGEVFGFLGPNGAGKSTIIKSIVGIQPITDGRIEIFGHDVARDPVEAKQVTGFVPDHYALYEKLTGREYVNYIADLYGVSKADRNERIEKYTEQFELKYAIDRPIMTYSHGMKQKITIMSALVHNPKLWILDEPLTGLDPDSIYNVKEAMKAHAKAGNVVFFSSHIIEVVERLCDRIAIIKRGKICAVTSVKELQKKNIRLEDYYISLIGHKGAER
jgi:ABC-2 type transport system ATP-binding protein